MRPKDNTEKRLPLWSSLSAEPPLRVLLCERGPTPPLRAGSSSASGGLGLTKYGHCSLPTGAWAEPGSNPLPTRRKSKSKY
jgi:hypothetical protein